MIDLLTGVFYSQYEYSVAANISCLYIYIFAFIFQFVFVSILELKLSSNVCVLGQSSFALFTSEPWVVTKLTGIGQAVQVCVFIIPKSVQLTLVFRVFRKWRATVL